MLHREKPVYEIRIDSRASHYDLRINDCPIFTDYKGYPTKTAIFFNQWAVNGSNKLQLTISRLPEHEGFCKLEVWVRELDPRTPEFVCKLEMKSPPAELGGELLLRQEENFLLEHVPFPRWSWLDLPPTQISYDDQKSVVLLSQTIIKALQNKNIKDLAQIWEKKLHDLQIARYQTAQQRYNEMEQSFREIWESGAKLLAFQPDQIALIPYANNRLFKIIDIQTRHTPFVYSTPDNIKCHIDIILMKLPQGQWIVIR
jgi:hypothetical protein